MLKKRLNHLFEFLLYILERFIWIVFLKGYGQCFYHITIADHCILMLKQSRTAFLVRRIQFLQDIFNLFLCYLFIKFWNMNKILIIAFDNKTCTYIIISLSLSLVDENLASCIWCAGVLKVKLWFCQELYRHNISVLNKIKINIFNKR